MQWRSHLFDGPPRVRSPESGSAYRRRCPHHQWVPVDHVKVGIAAPRHQRCCDITLQGFVGAGTGWTRGSSRGQVAGSTAATTAAGSRHNSHQPLPRTAARTGVATRRPVRHVRLLSLPVDGSGEAVEEECFGAGESDGAEEGDGARLGSGDVSRPQGAEGGDPFVVGRADQHVRWVVCVHL
jgi:hypothetical protein